MGRGERRTLAYTFFQKEYLNTAFRRRVIVTLLHPPDEATVRKKTVLYCLFLLVISKLIWRTHEKNQQAIPLDK